MDVSQVGLGAVLLKDGRQWHMNQKADSIQNEVCQYLEKIACISVWVFEIPPLLT